MTPGEKSSRWRLPKSSPKRYSTTSRRTDGPRVVLLFGPTGVGKTEIIERYFAGIAEVISVDALQIYRSLNIGTAKPTAETLRRVPHHLINIAEMDQAFSVGEFCRLADSCVSDILGRGMLPLLSGGTAYYMKAWMQGPPKTPAADPAVRAEVERRWSDAGHRELRAELMRIDPASAARIGERDRYRMKRAIEVFVQTGRPLSEFRVPKEMRRDAEVLVVGLRRKREDLNRRIARRVDRMLQAGLEREVTELRRAGARPDYPGMKAIGYREWFGTPDDPTPSAEEVRNRIIQNTRRYAKRQITFFASLPEVHWVDLAPESGESESLGALLKNYLSPLPRC